MNNVVCANEVKLKGISVADKFAKDGLETFVTVRGKTKYVILPKEKYDKFKDFELEFALKEAEEDLKNGKYHQDLEKHLKKINDA